MQAIEVIIYLVAGIIFSFYASEIIRILIGKRIKNIKVCAIVELALTLLAIIGISIPVGLAIAEILMEV